MIIFESTEKGKIFNRKDDDCGFDIENLTIFAPVIQKDNEDKDAFYGGTCLRIFHGLRRFSEDLDFSLLAPDDSFDFTDYFKPIVDEFASLGPEVEIKKKALSNFRED